MGSRYQCGSNSSLGQRVGRQNDCLSKGINLAEEGRGEGEAREGNSKSVFVWNQCYKGIICIMPPTLKSYFSRV